MYPVVRTFRQLIFILEENIENKSKRFCVFKHVTLIYTYNTLFDTEAKNIYFEIFVHMYVCPSELVYLVVIQ